MYVYSLKFLCIFYLCKQEVIIPQETTHQHVRTVLTGCIYLCKRRWIQNRKSTEAFRVKRSPTSSQKRVHGSEKSRLFFNEMLHIFTAYIMADERTMKILDESTIIKRISGTSLMNDNCASLISRRRTAMQSAMATAPAQAHSCWNNQVINLRSGDNEPDKRTDAIIRHNNSRDRPRTLPEKNDKKNIYNIYIFVSGHEFSSVRTRENQLRRVLSDPRDNNCWF